VEVREQGGLQAELVPPGLVLMVREQSLVQLPAVV